MHTNVLNVVESKMQPP